MLRLVRLLTLVPALMMVLPLFGADKALNPDKPSESPAVRAKLLQGDFLQGKLTSIEGEGDDKTYILEVNQKAKGVNAQMKQKYEDLTKQWQAAVQAKNNGQAQQVAQQMQETAAKYYEMVDVPYEFALKSDKDLIVRRQKLPPKEPEEGKPAKYTEEELKALKGDDPKVPGYKAEFKDLDKDIPVKVYLDKSKIKAPAKDKKKDKDEPDEIVLYHVRMFVILPPVENTVLGATDPKDPNKVEVKEDPKYRAKLVNDNYLEGKLVKAEDDPMGYVVEVVQKVKVPNPDQEKRYKELAKQQPKSAQEYKALSDQVADCKAKYFDTKEVPYQFQLETTKELKVRQLKLPPKEADKDGKPGKYTPDELKALRGEDTKLPGYTAEVKDLATDIIVRVYLDRSKVKPTKPKPGEEPSDDPVAYPATVIVIVPPPEEKPMK